MTNPELIFYNTLTRKKEVFEPIDAENVRMYVCGPTVYDFAHIGNARPAIVFDLLFRLLRQVYGADKVTYVRNITDVDDKINARARRDHPDAPLNEAIRKVTETTAQQYFSDMEALGCLPPSVQPRATENIAEMIEIIEQLMRGGHAYEAAGEVLFDVTSMPDYGALSNRNLDDQQAGARVAVEAHKRNPADFVLWKLSSEDEPGWDSPFGFGRPGWHLECSAMAARFLGQTFDIHAGGIDLVFPHHENEIAQSRCAHGSDSMARYWMHNGFLQVEGEKMSKSLGNFITVHDILHTDTAGGRAWPGPVVRYAMLMTHYRQPIDFRVSRLSETLSKLQRWARLDLPVPESTEGRQALLGALSDDLNTSQALAQLDKWAKAAEQGDPGAAALLADGLDFLGVDLGELPQEEVTQLSSERIAAIEQRVAQRLDLIRSKEWAAADELRDQLKDEGIRLTDSKDSVSGERITEWELADDS